MHPKMQHQKILEVCYVKNFFSEFCDALIPNFVCVTLHSLQKGLPIYISFRSCKTQMHPFTSHIFYLFEKTGVRKR